MSVLSDAALTVAISQAGVRELTRNSGPEVDQYLVSVGLGPGYSWCAAFVHWCWQRAADTLQVANPCPRSAGAIRLFERASGTRPEVPAPGDLFLIDHGHGLGHVGFVRELLSDGETILTVEGNTSVSGSREGDGVYLRARKRADINGGFLRLG